MWVNMNELLQNLLKLQALEFGPSTGSDVQAQIDGLRKLIPPQIMGHYDRLVARGKKGVAIVRNQVCTGCHMRLPIGTINTLMQGQDIQLCDTCGRYLCLASEAETKSAEMTAAAKPAVRSRKPRKPVANVAP